MRRAPLNLETQTGRRAVLAAAAGLALFGAAILYHFFSATPTIVRVGYSALPPYVVVDANGKPAGLAVEMIRRAASRAEIPIRWVSIPKTPDEAIEKNLIDLYPLLTITDKRKARFHLTESWWENESALISPEKAAIVNAAGTAGKRVATRHGAVRAQARRLFPRAKLIANPDIDDVEKAMCAGRLDAFFIDLRVLQSQLLKRVPACSGQALHVAFIPEGSVALATASSRASAGVAERLYREIAQLSLDGTLSELASRAGIFSPYQTGHMKDAINAAHRAETLRWGLLAVTAILVLTTIQTRRIRRAGMVAESARREADESRQRFDAFMQHTPAIAFIKDEDGRMVYCNDAYGKTFRTSLAEIEGKLDHELWPEEIAKELRRNDRTVLEGDRGIELAETVRDPSGELRHFLALKFPFRNRLGQKYLGGVALDITERKRAEQALRFSQFSIDRSPDTILWIDSDSKIFYANEAACRQLEYKREELLELSVRDIEPSFTWERFSGSHRELKEKGSMTLESHHRTRAGRTIPVEVSLNYLEFDGREFSCWMSRDITERKRAEGELSYQAKHDLLTGLPNRRLFENRLEQSIRDAERNNAMAAVFYLDLDGFKLVNDTLGHVAGDALLKQVAQRFKSCI
ncbi:MAG: PAS domain-containing protein, partial [Acidobacteriota bacterium]|nr:PAS domain-containing protein [Acidobacteriota bacterium]